MPFMYLHLHTSVNDTSRLIAEVKTTGSPNAPSLGTANSQMSHGPVGVFRIEQFTGLENISMDDLMTELSSRMTAEQIIQYVSTDISNAQLIEMVKKRMS
jgi:hypothetical protein